MQTFTLARHADITAVLNDPRFVVPTASPADRGVAWLRAHVSRFSTGDAHARRRALAVAALGATSPDALRRRAKELAITLPADRVPVTAIAEAMGVATAAAQRAAIHVAAIAAEYFAPTPAAPDAEPDNATAGDVAVAEVIQILGGNFDDETAARIGLLVQAHDATTSLVTNAVAAIRRHQPIATTEDVLLEVLRHDPPVRLLRRVATAATAALPVGALIVLDIAAANRDPDVFSDPDAFNPHRGDAERHLTLGAGIRPCPGEDQALAIAAGILEAIRETELTHAPPSSTPAERRGR